MILVVFLPSSYSAQKLNGICHKEEHLFEMFHERPLLNIKNDKFPDPVIYLNLRNLNTYPCTPFRYSLTIQAKFIESTPGRYVFHKFVTHTPQSSDATNTWSITIPIFPRPFGNILIIGKA